MLWGGIALGAVMLALVSANVASLVPASSFAALHDSRAVNEQLARLSAAAASLDATRADLLATAPALGRLRSDSDGLATRLADLEAANAAAAQRLARIEADLPRRVKAMPLDTDPTLITGAIGSLASSFHPPADAATPLPAPLPVAAPTAPTAPGASASVPPSPSAATAPPAALPAAMASTPAGTTASPATDTSVASAPPAAKGSAAADPATAAATAPANPPFAAPAAPFPMPRRSAEAPLAMATLPARAAPPSSPAAPDLKAIGIAVGGPVQPAGAMAGWQQIAERVGVMLAGMSPLLADDPAGSGSKVLVAGPLPNIAAATALCGSIQQSGLGCMPMPYVGSELQPATPAP